ncbi:Uncharacterised protein [Mycoplasmopsis edwardii]|uniref:Uncharacterized protein n=1 Tax=Mycoplasmopsis edwardii TaxID=53558 RepID=A0A3B0PRF4_9BACT|nr:Uncharacterised protein [Mycoplasmopsis edwardii]
MTIKYSKDLLKYQKIQCNNCFKKVTKVKILHFSKIYDHLLDYRYSRLFLINIKLQKNENHLKSIEMILDIDIINTKSKEILKKDTKDFCKVFSKFF